MNLKLIFGIPKGSLQKPTQRLLKLAGLEVKLRGQALSSSTSDPEIEVVLLRAQEIPNYVADGFLDIGITGFDQVVENEVEKDVVKVADLAYSKQGTGKIKLVLAVPTEAPYQKVEDLTGKRIATELPNAVSKFLKSKGVKAKVEFSWGSTEAKTPRFVDAIAEITETGETLAANNLRVIETIFDSTTCLIANPKALTDSWKKRKINNLSLLLQAAFLAQMKVGLKLNVMQKDLQKVLKILPSMKAPSLSLLADKGWVALEVVVDKKQIPDLLPQLQEAGAKDVIEYPLNKVLP